MSSNTASSRSLVSTLQEYSIPLILGVIAAVVIANVIGEHEYHHIVDMDLFHFTIPGFGPFAAGEHHVTPHWFINDIFMVFFFGIAAKEITEAMLPGGALNPPSKAVNPLLGTIGGVLGPVAVYFLLSALIGGENTSEINKGWGIPTATDIALAWLVARVIFGATHPAVNFLLLLAIADDALGLIIIAVFYPSPDHPVQPMWLVVMLVAMGLAFALRKKGVNSWVPYIAGPGVIAWISLLQAGVHPALALVPIVPFLPGPKTDDGLFVEEVDGQGHAHGHDNPLENFEHTLKLPVDFGLFFFGLANAGVAVSGIGPTTFVVLGALLIGKVVGIGTLSWIGNAIGFSYPKGMSTRHVLVVGVVAAIGLTVALFVAGQAFPGDSPYSGPAKLGALLSAGAAAIAIALGKALNVRELDED